MLNWLLLEPSNQPALHSFALFNAHGRVLVVSFQQKHYPLWTSKYAEYDNFGYSWNKWNTKFYTKSF